MCKCHTYMSTILCKLSTTNVVDKTNFYLSICFSILPTKKWQLFSYVPITLRIQVVVYIFQVFIQISSSQVRSWTGFEFQQPFEQIWNVRIILVTHFTWTKSFQVYFSDLHSNVSITAKAALPLLKSNLSTGLCRTSFGEHSSNGDGKRRRNPSEPESNRTEQLSTHALKSVKWV